MKLAPILLLSVLFCFILSSCQEKRSIDAEECYMLWAGEKPGKEVCAIHGQFWQSAHFTKEYIVYLELAPTPKWCAAFIKQNSLIKTDNIAILPTDAPAWFTPPQNVNLWKQSSGNTLYMQDRQTGRFFIYEEQL
jgi:hypothetical protein